MPPIQPQRDFRKHARTIFAIIYLTELFLYDLTYCCVISGVLYNWLPLAFKAPHFGLRLPRPHFSQIITMIVHKPPPDGAVFLTFLKFVIFAVRTQKH